MHQAKNIIMMRLSAQIHLQQQIPICNSCQGEALIASALHRDMNWTIYRLTQNITCRHEVPVRRRVITAMAFCKATTGCTATAVSMVTSCGWPAMQSSLS